jgi:predicted flap endonuclease-1-like 5' DNA nuclease
MYLLGQIWVFLALAGLLGIGIGWFLRGCGQTREDAQWRGFQTDDGKPAVSALSSVSGNCEHTAGSKPLATTAGALTEPLQASTAAAAPSSQAVSDPEHDLHASASSFLQSQAEIVSGHSTIEETVVGALAPVSANPSVIVVKRRRKSRRKDMRIQVVSGSLETLRAENEALRLALGGDGAKHAATHKYLAALDRENSRLRAQVAEQVSGRSPQQVTTANESPFLVPPPSNTTGLPYPSRLLGMDAATLEATLLAAAPGLPPAPVPAPALGFGDDLKKIRGVGRVLERWLHEQGIYTFRQIACMSPAELYWLVEALPQFGARVYRENWVAQADRLMRGQPTT